MKLDYSREKRKDEVGNIAINQQSTLDSTNDSITAYPSGYSYTYINTTTTTPIKTGAGEIHTITFSSALNGNVAVYDNTAGSGTQIMYFPTGTPAGTYILDSKFSTGLTVVTTASDRVHVSSK